jgi:hypothetical protein
MSARDELAEIIQDCGEYIPGSHADDYVSPDKAADAILAAGYSKPRTITTAEELDALPVMSVVLDRLDICYRLYRDTAYREPVWCVVGETSPSSPHAWLPATVLYEPKSA